MVMDRMSFFATLFKVYENPEMGMLLLYFTIFALSVIVYRLGFAKKLPILQNIVIYSVLAFGCTVLTFLGAFLPVAEGLVIATLVLGVYKIRLKQSQKTEKQA
ncbi:hypothetical protein BFG57_10545 [Bacillus solimangrovi]|uniref:YlaH-like protein n=2 Tax=Bacillus solimangrovi TaxID=1305675 RepID=A0A1E5LIP0_9BACI|nr:hypothetical protein BFG57_10545 [Bacillus solimangrovi]